MILPRVRCLPLQGLRLVDRDVGIQRRLHNRRKRSRAACRLARAATTNRSACRLILSHHPWRRGTACAPSYPAAAVMHPARPGSVAHANGSGRAYDVGFGI